MNPCVTSQLTWPVLSNSTGCSSYVLQAINSARKIEGLGPMVLPKNWYRLTSAEQLFVVIDLERVARGLPAYLGINSALSAQAMYAAKRGADPGLARGFRVSSDPGGTPAMGGSWSGGFSSLAADYIWMYDDGWAGSSNATSNVACLSASSSGCWAHRDELLGADPGYNPGVGLYCSTCEVGVARATWGGSSSWVVLIERPQGTIPKMIFTWAKNR